MCTIRQPAHTGTYFGELTLSLTKPFTPLSLIILKYTTGTDGLGWLLCLQNLCRSCYIVKTYVASVTSSSRKEGREKKAVLGRGEGRLFGTELNLKVKKNYRVSLELVVLLRSTKQRIKLGLTRGHGSAHRPPVCLHNRGERFSSHDAFTFSTLLFRPQC